jgi:hypothetical protein
VRSSPRVGVTADPLSQAIFASERSGRGGSSYRDIAETYARVDFIVACAGQTLITKPLSIIVERVHFRRMANGDRHSPVRPW